LTLLVGVATRKGVWIGADSSSVADTFSLSVPEPKVWHAGDWLVGMAGNWRALELVRYTAKLPPAPKRVQDVHKVIAIDVADEVRECFRRAGFAPESDGDEIEGDAGKGWHMLLGVRCASRGHSLYYVRDEHAERVTHYAVGLGDEFALGVLELAQRTHPDPAVRVRTVLRTTSHYYGNIRPPYRVESL
jgi:hypothetical protein